MSLNKFTDANSKKEWMNINCNELKCTSLDIDGGDPYLKSPWFQPTPVTVQGTVGTTPTSLLTAPGEDGLGSLTIPEGELSGTGSCYRLEVAGTYQMLQAQEVKLALYFDGVEFLGQGPSYVTLPIGGGSFSATIFITGVTVAPGDTRVRATGIVTMGNANTTHIAPLVSGGLVSEPDQDRTIDVRLEYQAGSTVAENFRSVSSTLSKIY